MSNSAKTAESSETHVAKVTAIHPGSLRTWANWARAKFARLSRKVKVALAATFSVFGGIGVVLAALVIWSDGTSKMMKVTEVPAQIHDLLNDTAGRQKADDATTAYNSSVKDLIFRLDLYFLETGASVDQIVALNEAPAKQKQAVETRQKAVADVLMSVSKSPTRDENQQTILKDAETLINSLDTLAGCLKSKCNRDQLIDNAGFAFCANNRTFRLWVSQYRSRNPNFGREFTNLVDTIDCRPLLYGVPPSA